MNTAIQHTLPAASGEPITVTPSAEHEYTLPTDLVAKGYGVTADTIRQHKKSHKDELLEGKHWVVSKTHTPGGKQLMTLWTKRGIVRLGFFIKSKAAKRFRDLAEDLIIKQHEDHQAQQNQLPPVGSWQGVTTAMMHYIIQTEIEKAKRPRTRAELRREVIEMLDRHPDRSHRVIADMCRTSHTSVNRIAKSL